MAYKPVGADENGKFPPRVQSALNATFVPKFQPFTAYLAGDAVLSPLGDSVRAKANFTSGPSFNAANWNFSTAYASVNLPKYDTADNYLFVSKAGSNSNDGRAPGSDGNGGGPKLTIQSAINTFATFGIKGEVQVGPGVFNEDITHYDGVSVVGAGSGKSTIKTPVGSTEPGCVQIAPGPVTAMRFEGFRIEASGNAGQHGIYAFARARPAPAYGDGGWWYSRLTDITVVGFSGRAIWFRGGGSNYLLPHQFMVLTLVRAFTTAAVNQNALCLSGQVGQFNWVQCQFDSDEHAPFGATMTVPNIYICPQLNDNGTFADEENPYSHTFDTTTIQGGAKAVYATHQCTGILFKNSHLEGFKQGFHADSNATLVLDTGNLNNVGNGDGTGYWANATNGGYIIPENLTGSIKPGDKTFIADGNIGSTVAVHNGPRGSVGGETTGLTKQVSVSAGGVVDLQANRTVFCTTSATSITSIRSSATPGESIFISAFTGPLTFATGSGLQLQGRTTLTVPERTVAQFVRLDTLNVWAFVGHASVLISPNGTRYRLGVENDGTLTTTAL